METTRVINISETTEIESKALALPDKAKLIVVDNNDAMEMADNTVKDLDTMIKEVNLVFEPMAQKAFATHREITSKWKSIKQPLEDAKAHLVSQVKTYQRKLKELEQAEERRLHEIARKQEEERRLAEALQAEAEGKAEEAQAIIEEPIYVPTQVVKMDTPKVDNRKYKVNYKARITDFSLFCKYAVQNQQWHLLQANESALNGMAKSLKENMRIPGVVVTEE